MFIAVFVVASTLGLSIQQREREIALLRAVAATPGQIRRMIAWEAAIVALAGSAAGIWPGIVFGRALAHGLMRHGIVPPNFTLDYDWLPAAAAIIGGVAAALLAVLAAGRRAARVPPTLALTDAAAEPRWLGPGRVIGGRPPSSVRSCRTWSPGCWRRRSRALSPVGGFLASANLGAAIRRF